MSTEPSGFSLTNTAIGTPQARWREITQSGAALDHAGDAVFALRRHPARCRDRLDRKLPAASFRARPIRQQRDRLIHRDEPLRRVAEDYRLLRSPGMRILMLEPAARDQHAGIDQRLDDRLVGVAFVAFFGEHALAGKTWRLLGESGRPRRPYRGWSC